MRKRSMSSVLKTAELHGAVFLDICEKPEVRCSNTPSGPARVEMTQSTPNGVSIVSIQIGVCVAGGIYRRIDLLLIVDLFIC